MVKTIWVNEGLGDDDPKSVEVTPNMTVGAFRVRYAEELGVNPSEIELSTGTKDLTNDKAKLTDLVKNKDTIFVVPRAKAGDF